MTTEWHRNSDYGNVLQQTITSTSANRLNCNANVSTLDHRIQVTDNWRFHLFTLRFETTVNEVGSYVFSSTFGELLAVEPLPYDQSSKEMSWRISRVTIWTPFTTSPLVYLGSSTIKCLEFTRQLAQVFWYSVAWKFKITRPNRSNVLQTHRRLLLLITPNSKLPAAPKNALINHGFKMRADHYELRISR